jgi:hypothetical protein
MAKIFKGGQFVVFEGTNMKGDSWVKGVYTYLDDAQVLIDQYDHEHPKYKKNGKEIKTTDELSKLVTQAGVNSENKLRVKLLVDNLGSLSENPTLDIAPFDDKELLGDDPNADSTFYFLIDKTFLTEMNDDDVPGGILKAATSTFTFNLGKKVNQRFLIVLNNKYGGGAGEPPGVGVKVPSGGG